MSTPDDRARSIRQALIGANISTAADDYIDVDGWAAEQIVAVLRHAGLLGPACVPDEVNESPPDRRPHSRACGVRKHDHGRECSKNCPTCHGRSTPEEENP